MLLLSLEYNNRIRLFKKLFLEISIIFVISAFLLCSCKTVDCPNCKPKKPAEETKSANWNIELKEPFSSNCPPYNILNLRTDSEPDSIPEPNPFRTTFLNVYAICNDFSHAENTVPYDKYHYKTTYMADAISPPQVYYYKEPCVCCDRLRDGPKYFDKLEIRAFTGYRGKSDPITYTKNNVVTTYESEFFGFGLGGSQMITGLDITGLWSLDGYELDMDYVDFKNFVSNNKSWWYVSKEAIQIGFLTGLWPIDGSIFIPVAFHARYTINQKPFPYLSGCNTWYAYGDIGIPIDFETGAPLFGSTFERQRFLFDVGFGRDWALGRDADFSIDAGIRYMCLPLPPCESCKDLSDINPFRKSVAIIVRFGVTL